MRKSCPRLAHASAHACHTLRGGNVLMTTRGTWKASERRMAARMGGKRVPVSGRQRGDQPDIADATIADIPLSIEHKYGRRILSARLHEALDQADAAKRSQDEIAAVTVEEVRDGKMNRHLVVIDAADWQRIALAYTEARAKGE
jgi:hypothetical protein